jgi:hypothetical protein
MLGWNLSPQQVINLSYILENFYRKHGKYLCFNLIIVKILKI